MSAASRRPYLGETVHLVTEPRPGVFKCRAAFVTDIVGEEIEIYALVPPAPVFMRKKPYDAERARGTWHYEGH